MSLPTPPGTSHRGEKENRRPGPSRVAWAEHHEYRTLSAELPQRLSCFSSVTSTPTKSILKKTTYEVLPLPELPTREATPEPSDPLVNLHYLDNPVARILAADAAMRDLIEAYSILTARLRASVAEDTDADASWPLFQPLRKNRDALAQAMCRDLARALEEPVRDEEPEEDAKTLPSPQKSPKKRGMSAEQAKHARDLCTTSHAVLKLLTVVFTSRAICGIFEESHLGDILTNVLAIPLAPQLPTPNARKTCALAIFVIQSQRLPADVLAPARDRIAYALRRGIEGELGKEGKKGSANDGLRAIHDLCIFYPPIFVPAFSDILPSVFAQLLAPTVALRLQACHALGGFAFGLASLPPSAVHSRVAGLVALYLTKAPLGTPSKKPASPTKDPLIIRTLRTTLAATEPKHPAQGPVWALTLLASFIIMLGSQVFLDERVTKVITVMLGLAMRHPKSSVRALVCLIWRCMTWAYFRPLPVKLSMPDDEDDEDTAVEEELEYTDEEKEQLRRHLVANWKVMRTVLDMGAGVSTVCALLGSGTTAAFDAEEGLERALALLKEMACKGASTCKEALDALAALVCSAAAGTTTSVFDVPESLDDDWEWNPMKLLPLGLFSANPGLLTVEYGALAQNVRPLFSDCAHVEDVRTLSRDELSMDWVFDAVIEIWKQGLGSFVCTWDSELPSELLDVWTGLWSANVSAAKDESDSEAALAELAQRAANLLILILRNDKLDLSGGKGAEGAGLSSPHPSRGLPKHRWKAGLKLRLVRELWRRTREIFPEGTLMEAAERVLTVLDRKEPELVGKLALADEVRAEWALLVADVVVFCEESELDAFWGFKHAGKRRAAPWSDGVRCVVWTHFVQKWMEEPMSWESSALLLGAPFLDTNAWEMTNEDLDQWDAFLRLTMDRALDFGFDSIAVIDRVASLIAPHSSLSLVSSTRISDLLLSHLDISDARTIPLSLCELVNDTLVSAYPPPEQNKLPIIWLLRTFTRTLDTCPVELIDQLVESVQDGLCRWVSDDHEALTEEEYGLDIVPVYQTATVVLMSLSAKGATVEKFADLLHSAFCGREDKPEPVVQAFRDLWESTYVSVAEPNCGWSAKIIDCLQLSGFLPRPEDPETEVSDAEEVDHLLLAPPSDDAPLSPVVPSPSTLAAPFALLSPQRPMRALPFPTTPTMSSPRPVTPPRPRKTSSPVRPMAPLFIVEPPSHARSPTRAPVTPKKRTPGPSVRKADKENASPLLLIASVAERIAQRSPLTAGNSVLGKRSFEDEEEEHLVERSKKLRRDGPLDLRPAKFAVFMDPPAAASVPAASVNPRKRKGTFLDAVEVPTLREVMRRAVSFDPAASAFTSKQKDLRRTQSAAKLGGPSGMKRQRTESLREPLQGHLEAWDEDRDDSWSLSSSMSSPLRRLREMETIGSDDSIMLESHARSDRDIPSSDDDPFIGQVTPHRLVSPALRRVKDMDDFDSEPGSDDSNMSASPTSERVARMSQVKARPTPMVSPLRLLGASRV